LFRPVHYKKDEIPSFDIQYSAFDIRYPLLFFDKTKQRQKN